jgi:septum formation protein
MPSELILASASPRRAALLAAVGARFRVVRSDVDETHCGTDPIAATIEVALRKARAIAARHPGTVVVAADTVVVAPDGGMLGKPADGEEAVAMLLRLAGRTHAVVTGVAVVGPEGMPERTAGETTRVRMRAFDEVEARRYVASGEPFDKAGAYGIQGRGGLLVDGVEGCYFNVVGLPLRQLHPLLLGRDVGAESWLGPAAT